MKYLILLFALIAVATISAQNAIEMNQDTVVYLTAEQEAYMIDKETKYLFKTGPLQFESKLSEAFSVNFAIRPSFLYGPESTSSEELKLAKFLIDTETELRHYYKLPRLIRENKQANNLSSTYVGLGFGYRSTVYKNSDVTYNTTKYRNQFFAVWGNQKRFLNYGYVDYGLKFSYENGKIDNSPLKDIGYQNITLSNRFRIGFVLGKRYDINEELKCPIFRCHVDQKSALKLNYLSFFTISYGQNIQGSNENQFYLALDPNAGYEYKIGQSSFSINQDLKLNFSLSTGNGAAQDEFGASSWGIDYKIGGRYYVTLKSAMRKGTSGNNLSGIYVYGRGRYLRSVNNSSNIDLVGQNILGLFNDASVNLGIGVGYQKMVFADLYFDIQYGYRKRLKSFLTNPEVISSNFYTVDVKIGKLF